MSTKKPKKLAETDEQYLQRIRKESREKILKISKPLDIEALRRSMAIDEPTHLGNLRILVETGQGFQTKLDTNSI